MTQKQEKDYFQTYFGQQLLKEHSLEEEGSWEVFGEAEERAVTYGQ